MEWLVNSWKYIQEDRANHYKILAALLPMARTVMDKKSGESLKKYSKSISDMLDNIAPWQNRASRLSRQRGQKLESSVKVVLGPGESADHPLFAEAVTVRER